MTYNPYNIPPQVPQQQQQLSQQPSPQYQHIVTEHRGLTGAHVALIIIGSAIVLIGLCIAGCVGLGVVGMVLPTPTPTP